MGQIVQSFIEDKVSSSAQVGIVQFGSGATVLSLLLSMNNQANKDSLVRVIPAGTSGSTAIGQGILSGIDVCWLTFCFVFAENIVFNRRCFPSRKGFVLLVLEKLSKLTKRFVQVLENDGKSAAGGTIIVLTDGNENVSPYVANIHATVTGKV